MEAVNQIRVEGWKVNRRYQSNENSDENDNEENETEPTVSAESLSVGDVICHTDPAQGATLVAR